MAGLELVLCSDTHQMENELSMPAGDILLYAGDLSMMSRSLSAIESFNAWMGDLPYRHKIITLGNHESVFEANPSRIPTLLDNASAVLINESIEVEGLKIFGSPATTHIDTAYGLPRAEDRRALWATVPEDTNVLLVHGPPYGILDGTPGTCEHIGDPDLLARIKQLPDLRMVVFGHVHSTGGQMLERDGVLYVNASVISEWGGIERGPIALRLPRIRLRLLFQDYTPLSSEVREIASQDELMYIIHSKQT